MRLFHRSAFRVNTGYRGVGRRLSSLGRFTALGAGLALGLFSSESHAFKPQSHLAVAESAMGEINASYGDAGLTLRFEVNGRVLEVPVNVSEVYDAVSAYPDYFRAGSIGPDAFADLITGQMLAHSDEALAYKDLVEEITGAAPANHEIWAKFEARQGISEYRSIDYPMEMLSLVQQGELAGDDRARTLAFLAGYFAHAVTDGFSHTWANEYTEKAWSFSQGSGIFGPLTEEVQHVAVETYLDSRLPASIFATEGDGGGMGRVELRAPTLFLDSYYAGPTKLAQQIGLEPHDGPTDFLGFYKHVDVFRGGIIYTYLNAQNDALPAMRDWTKMTWLFDIAEQAHESPTVDILLTLIEIPDRIEHEIEQKVGEIPDPVTLATGGYIDCRAQHTQSAFGDGEYTNALRVLLEVLGGLNDRVAAHAERARVARVNYNRLAECTAENIGKTSAADFDPSRPALNTDACADIVRAGWQDEGNPSGLYRGAVRPNSHANREFLVELRSAFLGGDEEELFEGVAEPWSGTSTYRAEVAYEQNNKHRSTADNVARLYKYLADAAFTLGAMDQAILPDHGDADLGNKIDAICADARDPAFERCLDFYSAPIVIGARQFVCEKELAECIVRETRTCLGQVCQASCGFPFSGGQCDSMCGEPGGCTGWCQDHFCWDSPIGRLCEPTTYFTCLGICEIVGDNEESCAQSAADIAVCGVKEVVCSWENIEASFSGDFLGDDLLGPVRDVCDTIDDVRAFFQCIEGDPSLPEDEQARRRRTCIVDACEEVISTAIDQGVSLPPEVANLDCAGAYDDIAEAYQDAKDAARAISRLLSAIEISPETWVNLVFIEEDLASDPAYRGAARDELARQRAALLATPPGASASPDEVKLYNDQIRLLDDMIRAVDGTPPSPTSWTPEDLADAMEALARRDWAAPRGATLRKILKDVGPSIEKTFRPFFNSVQGSKLAPMLSQDDIAGMFDQQGVAKTLLPAGNDDYSAHCRGDVTSLYCDAVASFDDPNCAGPDCPASYLEPSAERHGWVPGRGVVAYNRYDPSNPVRNVLTAFPLASTQAAYDLLYKRVFMVEGTMPGFFGFDDAENPWTTTSGTVALDESNRTEGSASLLLTGCGYIPITGPLFRTAEVGAVGSTLEIDVWLPTSASPWWAGDLQMSVTVPAANVNNQYLNDGQPVSFTGLPAGWNTLRLSVPATVRSALLGDHADAYFSIFVNKPTCDQPLRFDNIRFTGDIAEREQYHVRGSELYQVTTTPVMSFDDPLDWSATVPLSAAAEHVEGAGALAVSASGYTPVTSRWFSLSELTDVSPLLNVDVYIPSPQPNYYWYGDIQAFMDCQSRPMQYLGWRPLTHLFRGEFNSITFDVPDAVYEFLNVAPGGEQCRVVLALNVNPSGAVLLDNMGFGH